MVGSRARLRQAANWRGSLAGPLLTGPLASVAATCDLDGMFELLRTNDAVILSFTQSLLRDAGIECLVVDENMSVLDGSIGVLPRRVLVPEADADEAKGILQDAGIANEIRKP